MSDASVMKNAIGGKCGCVNCKSDKHISKGTSPKKKVKQQKVNTKWV